MRIHLVVIELSKILTITWCVCVCVSMPRTLRSSLSGIESGSEARIGEKKAPLPDLRTVPRANVHRVSNCRLCLRRDDGEASFI